MSIERKVFWEGEIPAELEGYLTSIKIPIETNPEEEKKCMFIGTGPKKNLFWSSKKVTNIEKPPFLSFGPQSLKNEIEELVIRRALLGDGTLHSEKNFSQVFKEVHSLKIDSFNTIGYFADVVTNLAYRNKSHPFRVRNSFVTIMTYLSYLNHKKIISLPVECDYGVSENGFYIQLHCRENAFFFENFCNGLVDDKEKGFLDSTLNYSLKNCDLLEIYNLKKDKKAVFSFVWNLRNFENFCNSAPALLVHQVGTYLAKNKKDAKELAFDSFYDTNITPYDSGTFGKEGATNFKTEGGNKLLANPYVVKIIVDFLLAKYPYKEEWDAYDRTELKNDLKYFPYKSLLERITEQDKEEVLAILKDVKSFNHDAYDKQKSRIQSQELLDGVLSKLNTLEFDELDKLIVPGELDEDIEVNRISASELEENGAVKVEGDGFESEAKTTLEGSQDFDDFETRIEDVTEKISTNEKFIVKKNDSKGVAWSSKFGESEEERIKNWSSKKEKIIQQIGENLSGDLSSVNLQDIVEGLCGSFTNELDLDEDTASKLSTNIIDQIAADKIDVSISNFNKNIENRLKNEELENTIQIKNAQIAKMRVIIDSLKAQVFKFSKMADDASDGNVPTVVSTDGAEVISELEYKNKKLNEEIKELKKKLKFAIDDEHDEEMHVEIEKLKKENVSLKRKLYQQSFTHDELSSPDKTELPPIEIEGATESVFELKNFNQSLDIEVKRLNEKINGAEEHLSKKDAEIERLNRLLDEARKEAPLVSNNQEILIENKALDIKNKGLEQKLKIAEMQLKKLQSPSGPSSGSRTKSVGEVALEKKLHKLEEVGKKHKAVTDRLKKEISNKKTELHKATLENKTLGFKVKDLERKLDILQKRKAS